MEVGAALAVLVLDVLGFVLAPDNVGPVKRRALVLVLEERLAAAGEADEREGQGAEDQSQSDRLSEAAWCQWSCLWRVSTHDEVYHDGRSGSGSKGVCG